MIKLKLKKSTQNYVWYIGIDFSCLKKEIIIIIIFTDDFGWFTYFDYLRLKMRHSGEERSLAVMISNTTLADFPDSPFYYNGRFCFSFPSPS